MPGGRCWRNVRCGLEHSERLTLRGKMVTQWWFAAPVQTAATSASKLRPIFIYTLLMYYRPHCTLCSGNQHLLEQPRFFIESGCLTDQQVWFPVDFQETFSRKFSRICSFINIYQCNWIAILTRARSLTPGIIAPISIHPGLLQDVFYWYTVKYKNFESARKFPGDFANFQ